MSFFNLEVAPDLVLEQELPCAAKFTSAVLGADITDENARSSLLVSVDGEDFVPVCHLISSKVEQAGLDLTFESGTSLSLRVKGPNPIVLLGYLDADEDQSSDDDVDSESEHEDIEESNEVASSDVESQEENQQNGEPMPVDDPIQELPPQKATKPASKPQKRTAEEPPAAEKQQKKSKISEDEFKPTTTTLKGGLKVTDITPADPKAPKAQQGQFVELRYIGRLTNGKVFDSNTKGKPFGFKLGRGEVIKGWDAGIQGLAVGQRRKLMIPPALAYGKRGAPPEIPPNATLEFEVKLVSIRK